MAGYNHNDLIFSPYDSIKVHRDTVWSCEFNKKGNFILTSSADSSVRISSLNGRIKNVMFTFATNYPEGISSFYPGFERNSDTTHHFLDSYYKKKYDANFAASDSAIIVSQYEDIKPVNNPSVKELRNQVVYFGYSGNDFFYTDRIYHKHRNKTISKDPQYFSSWKISDNRLLFAAISVNKKEIMILTPNGFQLLSIEGKFPLFSTSGENLFYLFDKTIRMIPLNINEIKDLVFIKKVFGVPEKVDEIWKLL
jgi:WD40 repeat protein